MIYNTWTVKATSKGWDVSHKESDIDREEVETVPNSMGWYHYPNTMDSEQALRDLRDIMIKSHKEEIKRIQRSLWGLNFLSSERFLK